MEQQPVDMGFVNNLAVIRKPGTDDVLMLVGQSKNAGRWVKTMTRGAAQALWFHLTQYLYPRAAEQLTPRAATAALRRNEAPNVAAFFEVLNNAEKKMIRVRGISSADQWVIYFTHDEGYELWAALEKILNSV